jgi:malonyl-CoA/methylmalonyl-CoA synthetase
VEPAWARHLPAGVDPDTVDVVGARSLPAAWASRWAAEGARRVLHDRGGWITADELEARSRVVAGRFDRAGLVRGDRVLMSTAACAELVIAHVAALRAGLVVVPMNGAYREREVVHIVRDSRPAAAIVDDHDRARWVRAVAPDAVVLGPDVALPDGDAPELDSSAPDDLALLGYTSGTTGAPKGAMLTHANLLATVEALRISWRWTPDDRLVLALPLFHAHGLCVGLHGTLLCGGSVVLLPQFDVRGVLDAARDHQATLFFGVPTMYTRLAASARVEELSTLRLCVSGSAPLPAELHRELSTRGGTRVLERYGMTETLMNASNPYDGERRPGSVGIPLPLVDIDLVPEAGSVPERQTGEMPERQAGSVPERQAGSVPERQAGSVPERQASEIRVRGPNIFPGYWERPDATRDAFTDDWFHTGDIGAWDDDGYLTIVGRSKELIISGGFNVYPREVEDVLLQHPSVREVAVIGTPSDEWGETVTAVVVANGSASGPADERTLLEFAAEQLAAFKRPRIVRYVDELPRNALGKVVRSELR